MGGGYVQGVPKGSTGLSLHALDGALGEVATPCLSCREGFLNGSLDDGSGGAPELVLLVGRLGGLVDDPPHPPGQPGTFSARWSLRR